MVPGPSDLTGGTPGAEDDRQPVPTGLAVDPDGGFFVGLLSEGWPAGSPSILHLDMDGTFTTVATDLVMVVALYVDSDGNLFATQLTTDLSSQQAPGNVLQIDDSGNATPVVDGLAIPHGTATDSDGNLYVAVVSINIAPQPLGQVLKCIISM